MHLNTYIKFVMDSFDGLIEMNCVVFHVLHSHWGEFEQ